MARVKVSVGFRVSSTMEPHARFDPCPCRQVGARREHDIGAEAAALLAATQLRPDQPTRVWSVDGLVAAALVRHELTTLCIAGAGHGCVVRAMLKCQPCTGSICSDGSSSISAVSIVTFRHLANGFEHTCSAGCAACQAKV